MYKALLAIAALSASAQAQTSIAQASCSPTLTAKNGAPSVASGYVVRLVANNLTLPRGIKFDTQGNLLVVEQGVGITALTIVDAGKDCLSVGSRKEVVNEATLNHGIDISADGSTLYASSGDTLWSWGYSPSTQNTTSAARPVVTGMSGSDHTSRTLLLSKKAPGLMLINRGSNSNLDTDAADITTGHSQIKAFNVTNSTGSYDFNRDGLLLGWGLRNDVGIDEEPTQGGIYSVENSADNVERSNDDIHDNNPAEKLNFLGYLNGTYSPNQGRNFGYPQCFAAWNASAIPNFSGRTGEQFAIGTPNATLNDTTCGSAYRQAPRLSFQAHMAPLDILFNTAGTAAWITFHGSWNRDIPVGYKLSVVEFANGSPTEPNTSMTAAVDIVTNQNISACPGGCFRPVGLAWDSQGRLFMSSDTTGEIFAVLRADGNATSSAGSNATGTVPRPSSSTNAAASPSSTTGAASFVSASAFAVVFALFAFCL